MIKLPLKGKTNLTGKSKATDLRAGAAMLVAGMMIAEGTTVISNIEHILESYENIVDKLSKVGGKVKIVEEIISIANK